MVDVAPSRPGGLIKRPSIPEQISDTITGRIDAGMYATGDLLVEKQLVEEFEVGRSSVRTALQYLQHAGLVMVTRGKGWKVRGRPAEVSDGYEHLTDVADDGRSDGEYYDLRLPLLEVRMYLEANAVKTASQRATAADIDRMQMLSDRYAQADSTNINDLMDADEAFHTALMAGAHNPVLNRLYQTLQRDIRIFRRTSYDDHGEVHKRAREQHQQIVAAISNRQPALAKELMLTHIETLYDEVRQQDPDAKDEPLSIFG